MAQDELLQSCINSILSTLGDAEAIVGIRRGLTIFSKNAQIPFLIDIAHLDGTGQATGTKRGLVALVTSNAPHQVQLVPTDTLPGVYWTPL
jgi:hypothetical protein